MARLFISGLLLLIASTAFAQTERIVLNTPIVTTVPNKTEFLHERISIETWPTLKIIIRIRGMNDEFVYPCLPTTPPAAPNPCTTDTQPEVQALIDIVNKGNHTSTSLWKKIMGRLLTDFPARFPGGATVQ